MARIAIKLGVPNLPPLYGNVNRKGFAGLAKSYRAWTTQVRGVGSADLGAVNDTNLFDMISKHGTIGRYTGGNSSINASRSGSEMIAALDEVAKLDAGNQIDASQDALLILKVAELRAWMDGVAKNSKSQQNPQNIEYTGFEIVRSDGTTSKPVSLYGHYRTPEYEEKMDILSDMNPGKYSANYDAVSSDWYSTTKGEAKNPLWQAMYSTGDRGEKAVLDGDSLYSMIVKADDLYEDLKKNLVIGSPKNPLKLKGTTALGRAAYEVDVLKRYADRVAANIDNNPNSKFITKAGNLSWRAVGAGIKGKKVDFSNDSAFVKRAISEVSNLQIPNSLVPVAGFIDFGQKQINQLMFKAADERGMYAQLKSGNKLLSLRQPTEEKKSVSWREVLKS